MLVGQRRVIGRQPHRSPPRHAPAQPRVQVNFWSNHMLCSQFWSSNRLSLSSVVFLFMGVFRSLGRRILDFFACLCACLALFFARPNCSFDSLSVSFPAFAHFRLLSLYGRQTRVLCIRSLDDSSHYDGEINANIINMVSSPLR